MLNSPFQLNLYFEIDEMLIDGMFTVSPKEWPTSKYI